MKWVIDSSMALAWALPDEVSEDADQFLGQVESGSVFWVPPLWWYEITNALLMAQRRKSLSEVGRIRLIELYRGLPIETDMALDSDTIGRLSALSTEYNISAYDAAYLELAQRRALGLATVDRTLSAVAKRAGTKVAP